MSIAMNALTQSSDYTGRVFFKRIDMYDFIPRTTYSSSSWVLETVHTVLSMHTCYYYLVSNFFNPAAIQKGVWSLNITSTVGAFIVVCAQMFFARRVYLIGGISRSVAILAAICLFGHIGTAIADPSQSAAITYQAFHINQIEKFTAQTKPISFTTLICAAVADLLLSGAIMVALPRTRTDNQSQPSNATSKFETAVMYIINTGLLTGVVHGIAAILSIAWPYRLYWGAAALVAQKMYAITLLAVLNSRKLQFSRGIEVFDTDLNTFGTNIFSRANQLAAVEQWNVPRAPDLPQTITIKVAAEMDTDGQSQGYGDDKEPSSFVR
ncbi:hypothetical protein BC628DRAFT_1414551 [Trametes gibbosa]|nr:hypothetical protein BC628DRAFT_1414551 [Trametes gibbosa]